MALLRSFATVGGLTAVSRVLGFVRDVLIAAVLGAGPVADAFFVAFRFPNLFRRLFAEGAFNAAFVPLFARELEQQGREAAKAFAEESLSVLLFSLMALLALTMAAMPWLMQAIAPGFVAEPEKYDLAVELTRITFPYLLFMALVALFSGLLNSLYRFAAAAAAPILLNIFFIAALALVIPLFDLGEGSDPGYVLAWTVAAAGAGQFVFLVVAAARAGMPLGLPRPRLTPRVKRLLKLMGPGVLSAGAMQINLLIGTIIASLQASAVSYLYYADRVYQLPLGLIGIGIGVVLLPELSRRLRAGAAAEANHAFNRALELSLFLTLPATVALIVVADPIVSVLFQRGAFGPDAAAATAAALAAFATGLPAYVLVKVLQPPFFAREDTVTPLKAALATVAANIALSLILFPVMGFLGLAFATAAASWINIIILGWVLLRRGHAPLDARFKARLPRSLAASLAMGGAVYGLHRLLDPWFAAPDDTLRIAALVLLVGGGAAVFAILALALGAIRLAEIKEVVKRGRSR